MLTVNKSQITAYLCYLNSYRFLQDLEIRLSHNFDVCLFFSLKTGHSYNFHLLTVVNNTAWDDGLPCCWGNDIIFKRR